MSSAVESSITPVKRLKLADAVAAELSRLITEGGYDPGDRLPTERELREQFSVGQSTMREALRSLEADGLVRSEHGVGTFVTKPDGRGRDGRILVLGEFTVPELFEVRIPLERDAAGLAAKRLTSAEADELIALIDAASDPNLTDDEFIELDGLLHRTIAAAAKNHLLSQVFSQLQPLFLKYSRLVIALPDRRAHAHAGHVRIVEAIVRRRATEARTAAVAHIRDVERDLVKQLGRTVT